MSRSNPGKKKIKMAKRTILIYGEGLSEEIFLKLLRSIYSSDNDTYIKIRHGKGGSPLDIVSDAIKELGYFCKKIVVLDDDRKEIEKAIIKAEKYNIKIIKNQPCLEATLLMILQDKIQNNKTSAFFKKEFETKYICKKKRCEISEYIKLFPKSLIEKARKKNEMLNNLISIIEN
ncbi:MAG TPA: hypothetical protein P5052_03430 [Candidatus Paceibacterota bacterium]|nr:hypothetical protein [Candidatus Paceibacterota bacterium]HRZ29779.1 hypothetical protein [Candidatus Paceibacterota bacterium]